MLVLALDSSRKQQSIALFNTETNKFLFSLSAQNKSSQLMPALVQAFEGAGIKPQELELLACSVGPGSFTGIRTALTIVKTMAAQLDLPIITVNNFDLLRHKFKLSPQDPVLMHAGKNDYFLSLDNDYNNPETNLFSFETLGYDLLDLAETSTAELIIDYIQTHPELQSIKYTELQPYYLREPSVNQKTSTGLPR
ncbi:MAG: tRNA (adenosine(37)-N6)-threonylcarbamoyltransferase complex dimerization subunit type 1 TsaB [Cyanobacteria bacterium]|nr:tRNA (adenosine(37)-N6)-threonylcarbamoyltransferase complex dimerization subunit type 1 TsaB [Cyanobacteriota bacterium]MDA1020034.1 tRNA (adenosine(37)-N6)-threonylcarbamoyltransferase complex dimerization subunit type 1 TsaB [Cyanobacteriota bacterium]